SALASSARRLAYRRTRRELAHREIRGFVKTRENDRPVDKRLLGGRGPRRVRPPRCSPTMRAPDECSEIRRRGFELAWLDAGEIELVLLWQQAAHEQRCAPNLAAADHAWRPLEASASAGNDALAGHDGGDWRR